MRSGTALAYSPLLFFERQRQVKRKFQILTGLASLVFLAIPASATTIYSTFGAGNGYSPSAEYIVRGSSESLLRDAFRFTSTGDFNVSRIDIAVQNIGNTGLNGVRVAIWDDNAGSIGSVLASWTITGLPNLGSTGPAESITGLSGAHLTNGASYWLEVEALGADGEAGWHFSNRDVLGTLALDQGSGFVNDPRPALLPGFALFDEPSTVPEPASVLLLGGALAALRRRRRTLRA